eukprot:EG_transcript_5429
MSRTSSPTATPSASATATTTASATSTLTIIPTYTATPTATGSITGSATITRSLTRTASPSTTATVTGLRTRSMTATMTTTALLAPIITVPPAATGNVSFTLVFSVASAGVDPRLRPLSTTTQFAILPLVVTVEAQSTSAGARRLLALTDQTFSVDYSPTTARCRVAASLYKPLGTALQTDNLTIKMNLTLDSGAYMFCLTANSTVIPLPEPFFVKGPETSAVFDLGHNVLLGSLTANSPFSVVIFGYGLSQNDSYSVGPVDAACPSGPVLSPSAVTAYPGSRWMNESYYVIDRLSLAAGTYALCYEYQGRWSMVRTLTIQPVAQDPDWLLIILCAVLIPVGVILCLICLMVCAWQYRKRDDLPPPVEEPKEKPKPDPAESDSSKSLPQEVPPVPSDDIPDVVKPPFVKVADPVVLGPHRNLWQDFSREVADKTPLPLQPFEDPVKPPLGPRAPSQLQMQEPDGFFKRAPWANSKSIPYTVGLDPSVPPDPDLLMPSYAVAAEKAQPEEGFPMWPYGYGPMAPEGVGDRPSGPTWLPPLEQWSAINHGVGDWGGPAGPGPVDPNPLTAPMLLSSGPLPPTRNPLVFYAPSQRVYGLPLEPSLSLPVGANPPRRTPVPNALPPPPPGEPQADLYMEPLPPAVGRYALPYFGPEVDVLSGAYRAPAEEPHLLHGATYLTGVPPPPA